jgi:hypothetical protein
VGVSNVTVQGLTVEETGGDGLINSGHGDDDGRASRGVTVKDCVFSASAATTGRG